MQPVTLTVREIIDLAKCAGLELAPDQEFDVDELDAAITIAPGPAECVADDDGNVDRYAHVAYWCELPEDGVYPLGEPLPKPYNPDADPTAGRPWPLSLDAGRMGVAHKPAPVEPQIGGQVKVLSLIFGQDAQPGDPEYAKVGDVLTVRAIQPGFIQVSHPGVQSAFRLYAGEYEALLAETPAEV